jgi:hypothetical protein
VFNPPRSCWTCPQRTDAAHEPRQQPHDRPNGEQRRERQTQIERAQDQRRAHQQHERGDQLDDASAHERTHLLDVVGRARHELPGLRAIVIAEAQSLDLREERVAQVVGHAL